MVFLVAFGAAVVVLFSLGVGFIAARATSSGHGMAGVAAGLCFAACATVIGYGVYLLAVRRSRQLSAAVASRRGTPVGRTHRAASAACA